MSRVGGRGSPALTLAPEAGFGVGSRAPAKNQGPETSIPRPDLALRWVPLGTSLCLLCGLVREKLLRPGLGGR